MKKERLPKTVRLSDFTVNPDNPQKTTGELLADLELSIRKDPALLEVNKIAFVTDFVSLDGSDFNGRRVVVAGNKRLCVLRRIYGEDGEVPSEWFYDLTPLGVEARRRWIVRSNVQSGDWDPELLASLYSPEELAEDFCGPTLDGLAKLIKSSEALDLGDTEEKAEEQRESNGGRVVSCPKCGFKFGVGE